MDHSIEEVNIWYSNLLVITYRFSDKLEELCSDTCDLVTVKYLLGEKIQKVKTECLFDTLINRTKNINLMIDKIDLPINVNNPSNSTGKISMLVSSAAANSIFVKK